MSHGPYKGGGVGGGGSPPWRGGGSKGWQRQDWNNYDYGGAQWLAGKGYGASGRSDCWKCVACGCGKTTVWASHCKHCGAPRQAPSTSQPAPPRGVWSHQQGLPRAPGYHPPGEWAALPPGPQLGGAAQGTGSSG
eukprot:7433837-Pyramimonas_sp.AAC.1